MRFLKNILKFISKYSAIPKGALSNILFGSLRVGFFFECFHITGLFIPDRNDIPILFTRISRFNTHQDKVCLAFCSLLDKTTQGTKVVFLHIRIDRTDYHCLIFVDSLYIMKIGRRQRNGRESIPATRLYTYANLLAKLISNGRHLRF